MNPDEAVALGAAVQAGLKARDSDLREVVLMMCPHAGCRYRRAPHDGSLRRFSRPIIERNTVIPASRERVFSPTHENQKQMEFRIYRESADFADNILIGKMVLLPPAARAQNERNCRFTYDINGLLEVDVTFPGSANGISS